MGRLRRHTTLFAVLTTAVLLLMACGGEDTDDETVETAPPSVQSTAPGASPDAEAFDDSALFDDDGDGFMTMDEYVAAVEEVFPAYRWPDGYTPTVATMMQSLENAPPGEHLFQVGLEHTKLEIWYECAWLMAWLDAFQRGDEAIQAEALQIMTDELPTNRDPAGAEFLTGLADSAALGDPSGVTSYTEGGCRDLEFNGPA